MNKVVVFTRDYEKIGNKIRDLKLPDLTVLIPRTEEETKEAIKDANIFYGIPWMMKDHINSAKKLEWIQSSFIGIDALIDDNLRTDYVLTNVKGINGDAISQYILAYILYFERQINTIMTNQKKRKWVQNPQKTLDSLTVGILGTGSTGKVIAQHLKNFSIKTIGFRTKKDPVEPFEEIYTLEDIELFLSQCDYVISILPSTKKTRGIFNSKTFAMMKKSATLINVGRGDAIVTNDLIAALENKEIKRAILDVFLEEPLPKESPLWNVDNLLITPHVSGYIISEKCFETFAKNYDLFIKDKQLENRINFKRGY